MATLHPTNLFDSRTANVELDSNVADSKPLRETRFPASSDFKSPTHPPASSDTWQVQGDNGRAPPSYNSATGDGSMVERGRYQPSQDWAYDASRVAARNAFARQKRTSFHKTAAQKAKRKPKPFGQSMRPAIAVDTSYSRHRGPAPRQVFPEKSGGLFTTGRSDMATPEEKKAPSMFKWLGRSNSVRKLGLGAKKEQPEKLPPTYELQETRLPREVLPDDNGFRFKTKTMRSRPPPQQETKEPNPFIPPTPPAPPMAQIPQPETPKDLHPNRLTLTGISPSDRPITIGFSVSPEQISDHDTPLSSHLDPQSASRRRPGSDAPTIVVTPAREKSGWLFPQHSRPRPPSSVYSRATNAYTVYNPPDADIPPVPAVPSNFDPKHYRSQVNTKDQPPRDPSNSDEKHGYSNAQEIGRAKKDRVTSQNTVFEEDDTPASAESLKGPTGLYIDTNIPPTPRRSRGWWNIITTPFDFTPSRWRFSPSSDKSSTPDVPMLPAASTFAEKTPTIHQQSPAEEKGRFRAPASASTAFSPATWEQSSVDDSPRTHDDLGISTGSRFKQSSESGLSPDDREIPVILGQGFEASPAPSQASHGNDIYPINNHYHYNGIPFHRDAQLDRSDTLRSTDTTPVVAVASLGTVLAARAVHTPNDSTSTPRSMNAAVEHVPDNARAPQPVAAAHPSYYPQPTAAATRSAAPHDPLPYFAPPPTQANSQQQPSYLTKDPPIEKGGTRRPFPNQKEPEPKPVRRKGAGGYWHLFSRKHKNPQDPNDPAVKKKKRRRRCCCCCCLVFLILLIVMAVLLGVLLPRSHHSSGTGGSSTSSGDSPSTSDAPDIPSQWLNLTGFPPIPTGVATIARPDNSYAEDGCISPQTMWSCAVPKEEQEALEPNDPDQPNFKLQIQFVNGTVSNTSALQPVASKTSSIQRRRWLNLLRTRAEPTPSPAVPSLEDQTFLGNTTDGNIEPFAGEETPFYITFYSGQHVSSRLVKRDSDSSCSSNSSIACIVPAPDEASDGTAAAANLLTFPSNQPLHLYNRGRADEHYGFYNYYDRSIFLKNNVAVNSSDTGEVAADQNGGSTKDAAKFRCTWRQTRFLVQIWTNSQSSKALLPSASSSSATTTSSSSAASATASSETDFSRPGSFPYPVTITLDRHGGNLTEKMVYCYDMDDESRIVDGSALLQIENRAFGGTLVNPAQGPFGNVTVSTEDGGPGGIDGGTGGCGCRYRNWEQP